MLSLLMGSGFAMGSQSLSAGGASGTASPAQWLIDWFSGGGKTASGENVTPETAMAISAVYRAIDLLAGILSTLPIHVYQRIGEKERKRHADHAIETLFNSDPSLTTPVSDGGDRDAISLREAIQGHVGLRGNGYAEIVRLPDGRPVAHYLMDPRKVRPVRSTDGRIWYELGGGQTYLPAEDVLHIRGLSDDGICGKSFVSYGRESLGVALAAEKNAASFYGNNSRPSGVLTHPGQLKPETATKLRERWEATHGGPGKAHRVAVLEEGMEWQAVGMSSEDAQLLESRRFSVTEIARWTGVQPHLLFDLERATFSNIEDQGLDFLNYTLLRWLVKWATAIQLKYLTPSERAAGFYVEFQTAALIAASIETRFAAYKSAREAGWLCVNEIRAKENMNGIGPQGDIYLIPANMVDARQAGSSSPATPPKAAPSADNPPADEGDPPPPEKQAEAPALSPRDAHVASSPRDAHVAALAAILGRFIRRDAVQCKKWSKRPEKFNDFLGWHYEAIEEDLSRELAPACQAAGLPATAAGQAAALYAEAHRSELNELSGLAKRDELASQVAAAVDRWEATGAELARRIVGGE